MNALNQTVAHLTRGALETAAPRKNTEYADPAEFVKKGLLRIVMNSHTTFRSAVAGALLNDAAVGEFDTTDIAGVINFDLSPYTSALTPAQIRDRMDVLPGDGKTPMTLRWREVFFNIQRETIDKIFRYLAPVVQRAKRDTALTLADFARAVDRLGVFPEVGTSFAANMENFENKYATPLNGAVDFRVSVSRDVYNDERATDSLVFEFRAEIDSELYNSVIESDDFSPYLVNLWAHNALNNTERRYNTIVDPRKASRQYASITKTFGAIRPKVNDRGFGIDGSGLPMLIPPHMDRVNAFMDKADSCVDEEGRYSRDLLVEQQRLHNQILYVDWLNDVMAYTSNQGVLNTYNLGEVHPLDKASEYQMLEMSLTSDYLKRPRSIISNWLNNITPDEALQFTTDKEVRDFIAPLEHGGDLYIMLNRVVEVDLKIKHLVGYQLEEFEDRPQIQLMLRAFKPFVKALNVARAAAVKAKDDYSFRLPSDYANAGLMAKLVGTEYLLQTIDSATPEFFEELRKAWAEEKQRARVDNTVREFEIPNLVVGAGGLSGLLPHQGRVTSSTSKTPTTAILPIQTGGGKTIVSLVAAIFGIKNRGLFPLITTKGRLVKGTITEINAVSQGKLNAMPLRPATIRRMKRMGATNNFKEFVKWFNQLPPNTIFVNSYDDYRSKRKLFEDLETIEGFGDALTYTSQYLMIVKLLGLRMFIGDESHMVKNPSSARSRNSYTAFSQGDVRMVMSGTLVSNTVVDLVGQTRAVSPLIFGDDPQKFADEYGIDVGLIKTDEDAKIIKDRLRSTTAYHEANREDWSYMLPTSDDDVALATLTERQHEFYEVLMQEAYLMMQQAEKEKRKRKSAASEDDDDDDEDDGDDDEDLEGEEAEEAALIAKAKTHLTKVEQFLVAPDENEQYLNFFGVPNGKQYTSPPSGEDLVSPKVRKIDEEIEEHLTKHANDLKNNKIIIFGWNVSASRHYMRHSRYAGQSLHYTAGSEGEEAVRRYKMNDANLIMCANEGSLREGENLQMTSLILRQQSVWAPGDHEQVKARMYRPDPRGKYNRDNVRHRWVLTGLPSGRPSLDLVKMARLVSKFVSNARMTYEGRSEWKAVSRDLNGLSMLKMNLELIFNARMTDIQPYIDAWDTFVDWENKLNVAAKRRVAQQLEQATGEDLIDDATGRIRDINRFIQLAMFKVTSNTMLPGSKRVYVPWTPGAIPPDPKGRGYVVKGQQQVPTGTVVYTEFGPAIVESELKKGAKVRLYDGRVVGLRNGLIMLVPDPVKYKQLAAVVKDPQKWREEAFDFHGVAMGKVKRADKRDVVDDVVELDNEQLDAETNDQERLDLSEDLHVSIINGWPALLVMDDLPELGKVQGWNRIDPFVSVSFRSWAIAERFLEVLDDKAFIPDTTYEALQEEMAELRSGRALTLNQQFDAARFRNFFQMQRKRLGRSKQKKVVLNPYWIAVEQEVRLAFDLNSHEPAFFTWLNKQKTNIPGITAIKRNDAIWINLFRTVREAADDLESLQAVADFDKRDMRAALVEVNREIKEFRRPRTRPNI